jgi:hypothetical protein
MSGFGDSAVNLLASDDDSHNKVNHKSEQSKVAMIPLKIEIKLEVPTQFDMSTFFTQLSDDDNVTINLLEQELKELDAKKKCDDNMTKGMMGGYCWVSRQGGEDDAGNPTGNPPASSGNGGGLGLVWGEEPYRYEWTEVYTQIRDYYRYQIETVGPDQLPPPTLCPSACTGRKW